MNIIELLGHLGNDPETRFTPSGQKVTNFRVATNVRRGGNDITHWWRVTVWGDHPLLQYLKKGSAVIVIGEMTKAETYVDKNGTTQISLEVTAESIRFPPFGNKDRQSQGQEQQGHSNPPAQQYQNRPQMQQQNPKRNDSVSENDSFEYNVEEESIPF